MKQLLIVKKEGEYNVDANPLDATSVGDGNITMVDLITNEVLESSPMSNFSIILGRPDNKQPFIIPEVDIKSLRVAVGMYTPASPFSATFEIPQPIVGYTYTAIVAKKGVVFNERNKWTATVVASTTDPVNIAEEFVRQINASSETSGVTAEADGASVTITSETGDYNVILADELTGVDIEIQSAVPAMLDAEYVKNLASQCAAGKGFNYLSEDGKDIYPGYPEVIDSDKYCMITLRFAVPRVGAKTRDEVVNQLVHIVCPNESQSGQPQGVAATLIEILGDFMEVYPN